MEPMPKALKTLNWLTGVLFLVALYLALIFAPREAVMGDVQRVFYFHVAAGWVGMIAFFITVIASTLVLCRGLGNVKNLAASTGISILVAIVSMLVRGRTESESIQLITMSVAGLAAVLAAYLGGLTLGVRMQREASYWDSVALSSVEIGVVFIFINIVTGSIWARPIWNTWWTWEPRLVTASVMELVYVAYLMLRQGIEDPDRRARFAAIYGILGFLSVPLTWLSIRLFRTIHPVIIGSGDPSAEGTFEMTPKMRVAFFFSLFTFTFIYITLFWHRLRLQLLSKWVEQRKMRMLST